MQRNDTRHSPLLIFLVFLGILLSCCLFLVSETSLSAQALPDCYDGSVIAPTSFSNNLLRLFYQGESNRSFIKKCEYRLFHLVESPP